MSDTSIDPEAYNDFIKLNESVCKFAVLMLERTAEFFPFAGAIKRTGL